MLHHLRLDSLHKEVFILHHLRDFLDHRYGLIKVYRDTELAQIFTHSIFNYLPYAYLLIRRLKSREYGAVLHHLSFIILPLSVILFLLLFFNDPAAAR
jgi:hypothetical protein